MKKLSQVQLNRYVQAQDAKLVRGHIVVDEQRRKNLQAWIPYALWDSVRAQATTEGTSMNKFIEQALSVYLLLKDEDVERILARHEK